MYWVLMTCFGILNGCVLQLNEISFDEPLFWAITIPVAVIESFISEALCK